MSESLSTRPVRWWVTLATVATAALGASLPAGAQAPDAGAVTPRAEVVAQGLSHPWAVAFLPQGRFLVTERPGRLRVVEADGRLGEPLAGLPPLVTDGQGGLLDLVLDLDFARNRVLYFCFSEPDAQSSANSTALARAELSADLTRLDKVQVIFSQRPKVISRLHFGCRIVQDKDTLFLTLGDRFTRSADAQALDNHLGKVVRVHTDGRIPADNPFAGPQARVGVLPHIWSLGHRNPQGATLGPDGQLWMHEHGPQGGDEINRPAPGQNHGWPVVSFGVNYGGTPVGQGQTEQPGMAPPLHHWTPSIAPSGMAFVTSERYGADWKGNLMVGSLKFGYLARLELDTKTQSVQREHKLLTDLGQRIRDVRQGPDGLLYVLTDAGNGQLLRLLPR